MHYQLLQANGNGVSAKQFFTSEGAKQSGKLVIEKYTTPNDQLELAFNPDHTYFEIAGRIKFYTVTGKWSVMGNQLKMVGTAEKKAGMDGRIYTYLITGNTITRTMIVKPPYNTMVYKQEVTIIKM